VRSATAQAPGLAGWLAITFSAAALGAIASAEAAAFYAQLSRPSWAPPAWLFAPVWSALYLLIAIAAWLVWRRHGWRGAAVALGLFLAQLAANALWSWLFFAWRQGALALAEVVVLWVLIVATLVAFHRGHRLAALLLVPYLAWVTFACALTYSIWKRNPSLLG
jgi:benzodiazapine receptor